MYKLQDCKGGRSTWRVEVGLCVGGVYPLCPRASLATHHLLCILIGLTSMTSSRSPPHAELHARSSERASETTSAITNPFCDPRNEHSVAHRAQFVHDPCKFKKRCKSVMHPLLTPTPHTRQFVGTGGGAHGEKTHPSLPDLSSARSEPLLMVYRGRWIEAAGERDALFSIIFDFWWIKIKYFCCFQNPTKLL
jgi:hypothetical protein